VAKICSKADDYLRHRFGRSQRIDRSCRVEIILHPDPPRIDFKRFYAHLVLAHVVYSVAATMTSRSTD